MTYTVLRDKLRLFEAGRSLWVNPHPQCALCRNPHPKWVRCANVGGGNVQYVALRARNPDPDLPVVVDVGINYTQGPWAIPGPNVTAQVGYANERRVIDHCNNYRPEWLNSCLVSPHLPNSHLVVALPAADGLCVTDFHLVMTNFSPWITTHSWSTMCYQSSGLGADLLMHPPYTNSNIGWPFDHLDDLYSVLENDVALWIGHGLKTVPRLFRLFVDKHQIKAWMISANLARPVHPHVVPPNVVPPNQPPGPGYIKF